MAALVLGILAIPGCFGYGLPGIVFGILALIFARLGHRDVAEGRAADSSLSLVKAGRICGTIGLVGGVLMAVGLAILFIALGAGAFD